MILAYSFFVGLFVTIVTLATLVRVSDRLSLIDRPGPRKIHAHPVPRVGGIAIAIGVAAAIGVWLPLTVTVQAFLWAAAVILITGIIDDLRALDYKWKLLDQSLGVGILLAFGPHIDRLPFLGLDSASPYLTYPITFLFMIGVTNAFNLFDGLDGLAGGVTILTIAALVYLSLGQNDLTVAVIGLALVGGIFGFLRFNTHPAIVFMGDAGSQFLGFTAGYLAIYLTSTLNQAINPVFPILILGLPLLDTFAVTVRRLLQKRSPFIGDRQHLHHRLIGIGFSHPQTVSVLYILQVLLIAAALITLYQSDLVVSSLLIFIGCSIFGPLYACEVTGYRVSKRSLINGKASARRDKISRRLTSLFASSDYVLAALVSLYLIGGAMLTETTGRDLGYSSMIIATFSIGGMILWQSQRSLFGRLISYFCILAISYLLVHHGSSSAPVRDYASVLIALVSIVVIMAIIFTMTGSFRLTPQDFLMMLLMITIPNIDLRGVVDFPIGRLLLYSAILFYATEYTLSRARATQHIIPVVSALSLVIIAFKSNF